MRCSNCGAENEPGRKFCGDCGNRLTAACPACGSANPAGTKFCGECGTQLAGTASAAPEQARAGPPDVTSERRLVSVMFADLVGFTTLAESRDPEEVRELLSGYFHKARTIVERYGGVVEKFIGDAVVAVWGTPTAHEDDAERAVRAALDLRDTIHGLREEIGGADLDVRAGVLTGEVAVTLGARGEGMVAGDVVNTASRLQAAAPPGTVFVGERTYRAAGDAIAFERVGEQDLKGKQTPVPAWRALQVVAKRRGEGRAGALEPPFVGREAELRLLREVYHATATERRTRLVSILGVAGIGKSRLASELEKYLDGLVDTIYWHQGRSPAYGDGVTFWALGEMVRQRAGIAETDDPLTTGSKLAQMLAEFAPDPDEQNWLVPRVRALLGLEESPGDEREELYAAWRTLFQRLAQRGPSVLVFEDLHWADLGLLDFIESLLEWGGDHPILIVTLARPELLERRPTWGAGQRHFVALHLDPLPDTAMERLLAGLAPGLPAHVVRQIVRRAEGIPLYAVEMVRILLSEERLVPSERGYQLIAPPDQLEVPATLQALIAARLDTLDTADRALVQDAAVLGQTFTPGALAAMTGLSGPEVESRLRRLVRQEVLTFNADPRSPERGQYGFVQALVREVAYGRLARRDRRARHLAAARYYESVGDEEVAAILASHYLDAYRATPPGPEADAIAAQTRVALRAAAERASQLHSYEQALSFLKQAAEVTPTARERAETLERAATTAVAAGQFEFAHELLREAEAGFRRAGDAQAAARATAALGSALIMGGRVEPAIATLEPLCENLNALADDGLAARLLAELARAHMLRNHNERALELTERALVLAAQVDLVPVVVEALTTRGVALGEVGRRREGQAMLAGAITLGSIHGLVTSELRARYNFAGQMFGDDPRASHEALRAGLEPARRFGRRDWLYALAEFHATTAIDTGEWAPAEALLEELAEGPLSAHDRFSLGRARACLLALRGEIEDADRRLREVEELAGEMGNLYEIAAYHFARHLVALAAGRYEEAYEAGKASATPHMFGSIGYMAPARAALWLRDPELARPAVEALESVNEPGRFSRAVRVTNRAGLAALEGDRDLATRLYLDAVRALRELELPWDLAMCQLEFAAFVGPDSPEAVLAGSEARRTFERLGATPFLQRLDELSSRAVL